MLCPKCSFTTFEHAEVCKKCGYDLKGHKKSKRIKAYKPVIKRKTLPQPQKDAGDAISSEPKAESNTTTDATSLLPESLHTISPKNTEKAQSSEASQAQPYKPFVSGHSRAKWIIFLLVIDIVLAFVAIPTTYYHIDLLSKRIAGEIATSEEISAASWWEEFMGLERQAIREDISGGSLQIIITILYMLKFITIAALLIISLMWLYRVHKNLTALGASELRFSPGCAIASWFIPIVNFYQPYQVVKEIWKASDPSVNPSSNLSWQKAPTSLILGWWWGFWLTSAIVGQASMFSNKKTSDSVYTMSWVLLVSDILIIVADILLILIIRTIDIRQEEKIRRIATFNNK